MNRIDFIREIVQVLAGDIGSRTFQDIERLKKTADYITGQFQSFGYEVFWQPFLYRGNTYYNIIAEKTGDTDPEKILVIGAHYDTVRTTPGADDNASGIAGLLSLARSFAGLKVRKTVRFAAFALEEPPVYRTQNMGSFHYARSLRERNERVEGMICLEMIGYFSEREGSQHYPLPTFRLRYPSRGDFISMVGNIKSRAFTELIGAGFENGTDLQLVTLNALPVVIGVDFSDHWSFYKFGFKALMVTDTAFYRNPHYHAPTDLPETLDYKKMAKVVDGLKAAVTAWSEEDPGDLERLSGKRDAVSVMVK